MSNKSKKCILYLNGEEPDQRPHSVASDLVLHPLPMSNKKDALLKWVNLTLFILMDYPTHIDTISMESSFVF